MINWKLLHRVYLTLVKRFYMNLSSLECDLCSQGVLDRFFAFYLGVPLSLTFLDYHRTYHICWVLRYV